MNDRDEGWNNKMNCSKCGNHLESNSTICNACGTPVTVGQSNAMVDQPIVEIMPSENVVDTQVPNVVAEIQTNEVANNESIPEIKEPVSLQNTENVQNDVINNEVSISSTQDTVVNPVNQVTNETVNNTQVNNQESNKENSDILFYVIVGVLAVLIVIVVIYILFFADR